MPRAASSNTLVTPSGVRTKPVAASPSAPAAAGAINAAIRALEAVVDEHEHRAREAKDLLDRLSAYAAAPVPSPPIAAKPPAAKRSPVVDAADRRARQAASMRKYRAAAKAVAKPKPRPPRRSRKAAAATPPPEITPPPPVPPSKPVRQDKPRPELTESHRQEIERIQAGVAAAMAEAGRHKLSDKTKFRAALDSAARLRRQGGMLLRKIGPAKLPLAPHILKSWRSAAFGSDESFEQHLATLTPPRQVTTEFALDENGCLSREKTAIDSKAAAPAPA